jgi:hypothetical protein
MFQISLQFSHISAYSLHEDVFGDGGDEDQINDPMIQ